MNLKVKVLAAAIIAFSALSYADVDEEVIVLKRNAKEIYEDSSEAKRIGKKIDLHYQLFGLSASSGPASALSAGYYLDRNKLVLLEVGSGKGSYSQTRWESNGVSSREFNSSAQVTRIGVHYKQFAGNSFYFRSGIDMSSVDYTYDLTSSLYDERREVSGFKGESLIGSFVIGNQWQWENFTLGCDWFGLAAPLTYKISSNRPPQKSTSTTWDMDSYEDMKKKYVTDSSGVLLRFFMGASF